MTEPPSVECARKTEVDRGLTPMGGAVAAIDVDPATAGTPSRSASSLDGLGVRIFAEVRTPGGNWHFYVAGSPELATCHRLDGWQGVDLQSFGALLFVPGTRRPKHGGEGYEIAAGNLAALADGGDPDGAAVDGVTGFRTATAEGLPDAVAVMDRSSRGCVSCGTPQLGGPPFAR